MSESHPALTRWVNDCRPFPAWRPKASSTGRNEIEFAPESLALQECLLWHTLSPLRSSENLVNTRASENSNHLLSFLWPDILISCLFTAWPSHLRSDLPVIAQTVFLESQH